MLPLLAAQAGEPRGLVIHVPQDNPKAWVQALNIVTGVPKQLGINNVKIEIVAQGPGLKLLTNKSPHADRVKSLLVYENITFSACGATMKMIARKKGKEPVLLEGVVKVPGGVARVMELQEQGYSYIRI